MKSISSSITLGIALLLWLGSGLGCGLSNGSSQTKRGDGDTAQSNVAGTYWSLLSMTSKGETEKQSGSPPDVEFCKNGKWGMLHYGGAREAGTYQVRGSRLIMKMEDGSLYGDFQIKRNGDEMVLDDGKYVLRLKYRHAAGC